MELSVQVEKPSSILRKMTVKVPSSEVKTLFQKGLIEVQRTAKLDGFRPGQAPLSIIKQFYGEDIRHRVFHDLIDGSFQRAVQEQKLKAIGKPMIDTPEHRTGQGAHDHTLHEDQDLTFIATFEVMPEFDIQGYTGLEVKKEKVEVTDHQVAREIEKLRNSHGILAPVSAGSNLDDGTQSSRPIQTSDFVDIQMTGSVVTPEGLQSHDDLKGERMIEVGSNTLIPGFEEQLVGMRRGEVKTFRIPASQEGAAADAIHPEFEFTVTVNEVKEKKLPTLDDSFAKQSGYESLSDLQTQVRASLASSNVKRSDEQARKELLSQIIEKNPFEIPSVLIENQLRNVVEDAAERLKAQGFEQQKMQEIILKEIKILKQLAESQVRSALILEATARQEKISISDQAVSEEIAQIAKSMNVDLSVVEEHYAKNKGQREHLELALRQDAVLKFLLDKAKIKWVESTEK